jgi:hypothetical protein
MPGTVGPVGHIYIPGISGIGAYTIEWGSACFYPTGYELEEDTDPGFGSPTLLYRGSGHSWTVLYRLDSTYYYRVRGINANYSTSGPWLAGDHPHVVDGSLGSIPPAPPAPGVTVPSTVFSDQRIPVSWSLVSGGTAYDVQVHFRGFPWPCGPIITTFTPVATGVARGPINYKGAIPGNAYWFRVRATTAVGGVNLYSHWSASSNMCLVDPLPTALYPLGLTISVPPASATGGYTVSWAFIFPAPPRTPPPPPGAFDLEEDTQPTFTNPTPVYRGWSTSFTVTGKPSGTYYYRVRVAGSQTSMTPWFAGGNGCVVNRAMAGPAWLAVPSDSRTGSLTLCWDPVPGASGYEIQEDVNPGFSSPTTVYQGAATSMTLGGKPNGTYHYRVRAWQGAVPTPFTAGGNPCVVQHRGRLLLKAGALNAVSTEFPGTADVPVLSFVLSADAVEDVTVTSLTVTQSGTLDLASGLTSAKLYLDGNDNGLLESTDSWIAAAQTPSGNALVFTGLSETIVASSSVSWLVTFDLSLSAPRGGTLEAAIAQDGDVVVTGSLSSSPLVLGAPVSGGVKTVGAFGSLYVSNGATCIPGSTVDAGAAGIAVLRFQLTTGSAEPVWVTSLSCTGRGTGDEVSGIAGATLYRDANGDGLFDAARDDPLTLPLTFASDDGKVVFPISRIIAAGASETFFLVYDFSDSAASTYAAGFAADGDVVAQGFLSLHAATVAGAPVWGDDFTVSARPGFHEDAGCGGGASSSGPASLLSWALLLFAFVICLASAKRFRRPAPSRDSR